MAIPSYTIGSAAAQALSRLGTLQGRAHFPAYRTVDLVNMVGYCASEAHGHLQDDPARARDFLIQAASRAIAAADRLADSQPLPDTQLAIVA